MLESVIFSVECDPPCNIGTGTCVENQEGGSECDCDEGYVGEACDEEGTPGFDCSKLTMSLVNQTPVFQSIVSITNLL